MEKIQTDSKVFVISGGSKGLGLHLIKRCLQEGHRVATFSRSTNSAIEALQANDPEEKNFLWRAVDAAQKDKVSAWVKHIAKHFGRVDVLVNNAGTGLDGLLALTQAKSIEAAIALNLTGSILLTQLCTKSMLRQRAGCVINISSVNAIRGHSGVAVYSATKSALDGFTRALARELGPANIRVNSVAPGYFESDMVADLTDAQTSRIKRRTPLGRLASQDDIANGILFLSSDKANFITGQTLIIDGGITC
jgi:3-oxoacyl-[acyl-carrier protein] reductase